MTLPGSVIGAVMISSPGLGLTTPDRCGGWRRSRLLMPVRGVYRKTRRIPFLTL